MDVSLKPGPGSLKSKKGVFPSCASLLFPSKYGVGNLRSRHKELALGASEFASWVVERSSENVNKSLVELRRLVALLPFCAIH